MLYHIVYGGGVVSGRRTSVAAVMRATDTKTDSFWFCGEEYTFIYTKDNRQYHLNITVSATRSWLYYENPLDPDLDKRIIREIDHLCTCDGMIFVIDSQLPMRDHNLEAFENLKRDLTSREIDIDSKPIVFQANKRDLDNICSMEWVRENFRTQRCDYVESIATQGIGTMEAIDKLFDLVLDQK